MSDTENTPNPAEDRKAFEEAVEEQRQEFIETDNEMHAETDEDSPVDVGEAEHIGAEPEVAEAEKPKKAKKANK